MKKSSMVENIVKTVPIYNLCFFKAEPLFLYLTGRIV